MLPRQRKFTGPSEGFVSEQVGRLTNKRIFRIQFSHNGQQYNLAIGDRFQDLHGERVIAILEGYFQCFSHVLC